MGNSIHRRRAQGRPADYSARPGSDKPNDASSRHCHRGILERGYPLGNTLRSQRSPLSADASPSVVLVAVRRSGRRAAVRVLDASVSAFRARTSHPSAWNGVRTCMLNSPSLSMPERSSRWRRTAHPRQPHHTTAPFTESPSVPAFDLMMAMAPWFSRSSRTRPRRARRAGRRSFTISRTKAMLRYEIDDALSMAVSDMRADVALIGQAMPRTRAIEAWRSRHRWSMANPNSTFKS